MMRMSLRTITKKITTMDETPEELGLKAGNYPESEAKLMELLSTHEGREQLACALRRCRKDL